MIGIVIVGVGGQGTLLASKILGHLALKHDYDVRVSEVHGMSQRGGSVVTYVRMARDEKVYSTIVEQEQADVVLAFENLEALRALPYLKQNGLMIVNTQEILPMPVVVGAAAYPNDHVPSRDAFASVKMHTHLFRYFNGRSGAAALRARLNQVRTLKEIYDCLDSQSLR